MKTIQDILKEIEVAKQQLEYLHEQLLKKTKEENCHKQYCRPKCSQQENSWNQK